MNKGYLIDTHVFLWMLTDEHKLSVRAKIILENKDNPIFMSTASLWELAIKYSLGKIEFPTKPEIYLLNKIYEENITVIPITPIMALKIHEIPQLHKDPFDRFLITQAIFDNIPLISNDIEIKKYKKHGLKLIW
ncbi:type II toxin-antitoxin system VapC family toxin [bacterium]|jgi:PIN domain nuclease of toxin-antitoxin system|nr:type II toxin-antitoxin system VapC family toxin [bacterium]MBT4552030.1 type II toxin-antitoxin system VapC family toxin [bacterium]MBT5988081.1 type II toxin-antitoxin system VapC family toxin [bacterium]